MTLKALPCHICSDNGKAITDFEVLEQWTTCQSSPSFTAQTAM